MSAHLPVARKRGRFGARLRAFAGDRSGDVALVFGLMAIVMFLFIGGAIDVGRWLHARTQTLRAMDAAVLAGGRALQLNGNDVNGAILAAKKFYAENVKTRLKLKSDNITFAPTDNNMAFTASGNAYIETPILALANIKEMPLISAGKVEYSKSQIAVGGNAEVSLEISMMLDTSGSMAGSKLTDLKAAANDLIDIVVWSDQSKFTSKVALAPFSTEVRVPASMLDSVRGSGLPSSKTISCGKNCTKTYKLTPCVAERVGTNKYTDVAPGSGNYVLPVYATSNSCAQTSVMAITPLTSNKTALHSAINALDDAGSTAGHLGTAWAWYLLSPNWANVLPASSAPAAYNKAGLQKIAILMTDGEYNLQYSSDGISVAESSAANGSSVTQAKAICTAMKNKGITVYTVGFDLGGNQTAITTLKSCATSAGQFYNADNGEELKQAFRDIALKISSLYLSK